MKKFYETLAQNCALAEERDERIAKVTLEFAAEKGFEFTAEDQSELSDEELDHVNGGVGIIDSIIRKARKFRYGS